MKVLAEIFVGEDLAFESLDHLSSSASQSSFVRCTTSGLRFDCEFHKELERPRQHGV